MTDRRDRPKGEPLLRLAGVSKAYEEAGATRSVLHEVSLSVGRGEIAVLLGKSGSGKSTLLNLVSGIDTPSTGEVWVDGQNLTRLSERDRTLFRRRSVGFIFQFFNLVPTLTVLENVLLPLELNGRSGPEARAAATAMLAEVGLAERGASYPDRLSGGEQQRVAIARAIVHSPALILADEPTGNLDADTGQQVLSLLDRLTRQANRTMVMVTHSPEVVGMADRVFRISDGRLHEDGLPIER
ncbi:ABC transporter ATP-binding protein [Chloroflexales bacterium ZM16-3]|nr:ABC transporter ATP-binding protein [Chloroflexales bacterium ZM16-3]